jgi:decaprenylphospho-beta-D-ribofuranose 2-oxidase
MFNYKSQKIYGWGKYPIQKAHLYRPERENEITDIVRSNSETSYISRGLGRSYGDSSLNKQGGVILNTHLNKFISFDPETGVLEAEAGVPLKDILDIFVLKGFFLPVTPGTKYVTLGGAIANDIHGKNHHKDGNISAYIDQFSLLLASGETVNCSRGENSEIFWATIGGIGLTGIILTARITLIPVESAYIEVHYDKAKNLNEAFELFYEGDDDYQYSVAWIDCLASGNSLGRSVLMRGNHASAATLPKKITNPLNLKEKNKLNVPFNLPSFVLNPFSIGLFNTLYYSSYQDDTTKIVGYDSFFYPLDSILNWNRAYGKKGFVQYQVVFPAETSKEALRELLKKLSEKKVSSFLAVLKSFSEGNPAPLSFPFKGHTLALDIPIKDHSIFILLKDLDQFVIEQGGRTYLAKDAVLSPESVRKMYPELPTFLDVKRQVDPNNVFSSSMARRLGMAGV